MSDFNIEDAREAVVRLYDYALPSDHEPVEALLEEVDFLRQSCINRDETIIDLRAEIERLRAAMEVVRDKLKSSHADSCFGDGECDCYVEWIQDAINEAMRKGGDK